MLISLIAVTSPPIMQNVPAQRPLITRRLWLTFALCILALTDRGSDFSHQPRFLQSAKDSTARRASGGPGAPVMAGQAEKRSLKNKSGLMKLCLLGFFKKHEDWEVLKKKKRISWKSVVLAFFCLWTLKFMQSVLLSIGFQGCSVLPGFPIKP